MNSKAAVLCSLFVVLAGCSQSSTKPAAKAEFLNSPAALQRNLPFSEAVRAGDLLFLAGQMGTDPATGQLVPGGLEPEARQAIENMKSVLERNGRSLADVVKCTVFLADINEWGKFNDIYKQYFKAPYPARSALGVNGLARGGRLEIECIAYAPAAQS
jgi:2-iminobutanoate/2-iminopropanoate deaminase